MHGKHPNSRHAAAHNFALHQVCGAIGIVQAQLAQCKSLTPDARLYMEIAAQNLRQAEECIRAARVETDGSIKEFEK